MRKYMKKLTGKWAFITGSSRGIGQKIAIALAKRECNIIIHGRAIENTKSTLALLREFDIKVEAVAGELDSEEGVDEIIHEVKNVNKQIDILYNNAAIGNEWGEAWEIPIAEWKRTFQVNLFAVVQICNSFIPEMVKRDYGRVINLSSGIKDTPQLAPYSVTKAAIDKYTSDMAAELRGTNVKINSLDPGWLQTDMGGPDAEYPVERVIPGALVPVLIDEDGPSGRFIRAQDYNMLEG
jgi:3-oxoacyl-[acyl-carrier protein] reductase